MRKEINNKKTKEQFTSAEYRQELDRVLYKNRFAMNLRQTISILVVVAAISILIAVLLLPVLRIYGHSMNNTLEEKDIVISLKGSDFEIGDVIAFYYNNKVLVKRVIGNPGDWIDIDEKGNVFVNGEMIDEPYIKEKAFGECNIDLPYQVPENKVFVMGDNRSVSIDSRNTSIGCVAEEQIVGRIVFRIWPLKYIGKIR